VNNRLKDTVKNAVDLNLQFIKKKTFENTHAYNYDEKELKDKNDKARIEADKAGKHFDPLTSPETRSCEIYGITWNKNPQFSN